jgi:predicted transcriptional regulator with HTH domain
MKKLIVIAITALALNGCAIIDIYRQAKWDNNEYALVNEVQTTAALGIDMCAHPKDVVYYVDHIYSKSLEFRNYTAEIDRNLEANKMAENLLGITKGLKERYHSGDDVSQKYCELKMTTIQTSSSTIKRALGAKPR